MDELTPAEVRAIAAEIDAWNSHYPRPEMSNWRVHAIIALDTPTECYEVVCHQPLTKAEGLASHLQPG